MNIVSDVSTVVGVTFRLKDVFEAGNSLWSHIQYVSNNPEQKAKLIEGVRKLQRVLESLSADPDDATYQLILANLQSADELVRSVSATRGPRAWLMSTKDHIRLQEAESKLDHLITQCTFLNAHHQSTSTTFNLTLNSPLIQVGLDRSANVLTFLEKSNASKQPLRVIVIYGQAGIGKTTLLETIWQEAASKLPFLAQAYVQIGESPRPEDITKLQSDICQQLGSKYVKFTTENFGKAALHRLFQSLKAHQRPVFLAIDNIFEAEHLTRLLPCKLAMEDMPSSTCIAVTCRDQSVGDAILRICHLEADNVSQVFLFEPRYLDDKESKELFAEFARIELSDPAHQDLLHAIVPLCGGLPLGLQVLGSIFTDKKQRELKQWRRIQHQWATFDDSGNRHTSRITKAFHLSYELLQPSRKEAFRDVVSTFYGWPWKLVEYVVDEEIMKDLYESSLIWQAKTNAVKLHVPLDMVKWKLCSMESILQEILGSCGCMT